MMYASTQTQSSITTPAAIPSGVLIHRVTSIDVVRGLAIISIIGADRFTWAVRSVAGHGYSSVAFVTAQIAAQFEHAEWEGFRFYDLILPLLIFVTGTSLVFSVLGARNHSTSLTVFARVLRRAVILYALGIVYYAGLTSIWSDVRLLGVLQRIAICYFVTALLLLHFSAKTLSVIIITVLLGYWFAFEFISIDELGAVTYSPEANLAHWFDQRFLPGRLWYHTWDPEGLFSTIPAIATCLFGALAGLLLRRQDVDATRKTALFVVTGLILLTVGSIWGLRFPIIKAIWTSSYVLVAAGFSFLLLGLACFITEVRCLSGSIILVWIGSNAIALYLFERFVGFANAAEWLLGVNTLGHLEAWKPGAGLALCALLGLALAVLLAKLLYSRGLFLRV